MITAVFVGIDNYRDPAIRDLTGAARDATALWALFVDSMPDITAQLIRDSSATASSVRAALKQALEGSAPEDLVIITFSGHGTHDHRLVLHDTELANLAASAIAWTSWRPCSELPGRRLSFA